MAVPLAGRARVQLMSGPPRAAGLRSPVVNPGNSWSVPRISMPDFFSVQWDFGLETWFFGGHAIDDEGALYSVNVYFGREALDPDLPAWALLQGVAVGAGIGVPTAAGGDYHVATGESFVVSQDPRFAAGLTVPPVTDHAFSVTFAPLSGAVRTAAVRFVDSASDDRPAVGMPGAAYRLDFTGTDADGAAMSLGLDLVDDLGARMEGCSAYVGVPIDPTGLYTYEVAQPRLRIRGGTLSVAGRTVTLAGGNLWHDRQVYNAVTPAQPAPKPAAGTVSRPLYCGTWMPLLFDNGLTATISSNWQPLEGPGSEGRQWIAGRAVGHPPIGGTGNLYLADRPELLNGGALLRAIRENSDEPWDFDINLFEPHRPEASPCWRSKAAPYVTYCTKWAVTFSDRLVAQFDLPREIYLVALVDSCEFTPSGQWPFWEGAVDIFSDRACTERIGRGWAEQMGYN
jgi:hypothetical protein